VPEEDLFFTLRGNRRSISLADRKIDRSHNIYDNYKDAYLVFRYVVSATESAYDLSNQLTFLHFPVKI
jgi:hypothetical protein